MSCKVGLSSLLSSSALRPDLILITKANFLSSLLVLKLIPKTLVNVKSYIMLCRLLQQTLLPRFVNLSLGVLGTTSSSSESVIAVLKSLGFNSNLQKHACKTMFYPDSSILL